MADERKYGNGHGLDIGSGQELIVEGSLRNVKGDGGLEGRVYTVDVLGSYDGNRHIKLDEAYELLRSQEDVDLSYLKLEGAVSDGNVHVYEFEGERYLDRLDIGRVYHKVSKERPGMKFKREFSKEGEDPYESVGTYSPRNLEIKDFKTNEVVWSMEGAEFPSNWNGDEVGQKIVAQKYFFRPEKKQWKDKIQAKLGRIEEFSIRHLTKRVTDFFTDKGDELGYFSTEEDREAFRDDLAWLQIQRKVAFNSPSQFNGGIYNTYGIEGSEGINYHRDPETGVVTKVSEGEFVFPQMHACFIKGPRDDLESIARHTVDEFGIFSAGSGIGQDIGVLREEGASLSGGGKSSGPMSFLGVYDKGAGTVKSGGKSRRAARMTTMRSDHPNIGNFIQSKVAEDKKALILMQAGLTQGMDGEAYATVGLQNTNISTRSLSEVFDALKNGGNIELRAVKTGEVVGKMSAERMLKEMAFGAWRVGDPGIQHDDKIHEMHTAKNSGRQKSTNPCGEYMFLDDTSCNLASINLLAFSNPSGEFDYEGFRKAVRVVGTSQDIANDAASLPVRDIAQISPEFRTIGIGYANLGALLMRKGLAYDSDEGRNFNAAITAILTGTAYETSAELAEALEPFVHYELNKVPMAEVMEKHRKSLDDVVWDSVPESLQKAARNSWDLAIEKGKMHGYRNAQASVIAPTGTISFLMGCDTTGIEPAPSLMITKNLAGGGNVTIANREVPNALSNLGYSGEQIKDIVGYMEFKKDEKSPARGTVRGAPHLNPDHYKVFDTAFGGSSGEDSSISPEGHIRMAAAAQPFVSGGISKTMNFPENTTVKEIYDALILSYELGLKGLTAFRNNSKPSSAMGFKDQNFILPKRGEKVDLPQRRAAFESEVSIGGTPLHVIASEYENGLPGQITFLSYRAGSTMGALLTTAGVQASRALKRGVSLEDITAGWLGQEFEPKGFVRGHPDIKNATSPLDFAAKLFNLEYLGNVDMANEPSKVDLAGLQGAKNGAFYTLARASVDEWNIEDVLNDPLLGGFVEEDEGSKFKVIKSLSKVNMKKNERGVSCSVCGNIMVQTAPGCFSCKTCGDKIGGCGL